jgi:hypothetical protein
MEMQGIKERLEANLDRSVSQLFDELEQAQKKTFYDFECWVGTAWAKEEHDDPIEVLEGCLLVAGPSYEAALAELEEQIREIGTLEEYDVMIRKVK